MTATTTDTGNFLAFGCPRCGHVARDEYETLDAMSPTEWRCDHCARVYNVLLLDCPHCASQTVAVGNPELLPRFANIASRIPAATDGAEVGALLAEAVALLGADAGAFASFMKDDEHETSYRFILACDPAWCLEYENWPCFMHDPWIAYARHHSEPMLANRIVARTERERQVVAMARRYGFESALIVPAQSPQGLTRLGGLCLGSSQPGYFDGDGFAEVAFAATPLAMRLHEWQVTQLRQELLDRAQLSETDIILLRHARDGQGSKESAAVLKVNPVSIDSRWQRLKARLGVNSRISAASMAAEYGLI